MRAFIAVDAPAVPYLARLQQELIEAGNWTNREVKPVEPSNFHFTLIFLGELQENQVADISSALSEIQFEKFSLSYSGAGAFPSADSARVIWVGVDSKAGANLVSLAKQVNSKLAEMGFRPDKPFSPHLTLLRAREKPLRAGGVLAKFRSRTQVTEDSQVVDKVHLKRSELRPSGPIYSNVYTVEAAPSL